jgi:predicted ATP-dependent endonuclease of OLD family
MTVSNSEQFRLVAVRVQNFGCFFDSTEVTIDDINALIAENENGKTTFLRSLAWWGQPDTPFDEEDRWDGADKNSLLDLVSLTFDESAWVFRRLV